MAPVFQQIQSNAVAGGVNSITVSSFAVGSGANRTLVAVVGWRDDTTSGVGVPEVSSVVFNGTQNFTRRAYYQRLATGDNYHVAEIWTLDNPSNATGDIVATLSQSNDSTDGLFMAVLEYTGANNGVGLTAGESSASGRSHDITLATTDTNNIVIYCGVWYGDSTSTTPGTDVSERYDAQSSTSTESGGYVVEKAAGASGTTVDVSISNSRALAEAAIELKAAAAAAGGKPAYYYQMMNRRR